MYYIGFVKHIRKQFINIHSLLYVYEIKVRGHTTALWETEQFLLDWTKRWVAVFAAMLILNRVLQPLTTQHS